MPSLVLCDTKTIYLQPKSPTVTLKRKKTFFKKLAVKINGYVHKNGHSSNSQYLRQSRPVNYVTQRYNKTKKKRNKKYSRRRQVQLIFEGFSLCGSPTSGNINPIVLLSHIVVLVIANLFKSSQK